MPPVRVMQRRPSAASPPSARHMKSMQSLSSGSGGSWPGGSGDYEPGRQSPSFGGSPNSGAWMGQHMVPHPITLEKREGVMSLGRMVIRHKLRLAFGRWRRQFREEIGKLRMRRIMSKKQLSAAASTAADNPNWENVDKADVDLRTRRMWNSFDQVVGLGAGVSARNRRCFGWWRRPDPHGHRYMLHPFGNLRGSWDILILLLMIWVGSGLRAYTRPPPPPPPPPPQLSSPRFAANANAAFHYVGDDQRAAADRVRKRCWRAGGEGRGGLRRRDIHRRYRHELPHGVPGTLSS